MSTLTKLKENIESVIVGKGKVIDMVMTSLIAGGHILLEDVPGTGKTVMAKLPALWMPPFPVYSLHQICCHLM